ncbi:MAG: histidine kinase [Saprospiraceae bacterium]
MKRIPLFIFIFNFTILFSQSIKIDSLKLELVSALYDTSRAKLVNELGLEFLSLNEYDSVIHYISNALILTSKINYKHGQASLNNTLGRAYYLKFKFPESQACYELALSIFQELNLKSDIGKSYLGIAGNYYMRGHYTESLKFCYTALQYFEEDKNTLMEGFVIVRIGLINYYLKNYKEALKNFEQALVKATEVNDYNNISFSQKNIGVINYIQGEELLSQGDTTNAKIKYTLSIEKYFLALEICNLKNDKLGLLQIYHPLGNTYERLGKIALSEGEFKKSNTFFKNAMENFQLFLAGSEKVKDKNYSAEACFAIGNLSLFLKKTNEAKFYFDKGLQLSKEIGMKENIKIGYCYLSDYYSVTKDYKKALEYHKLCIDFRDSLVNSENSQKSDQLKSNYEIQKKVDSIQVLTTSNQLQLALSNTRDQRNRFLVTIFITTVFFGSIGFYSYKKKKQIEKIQALNQERLRISSELHDEVGATLSGISMYSHLAKSQLKSNMVSDIEKSLNVMQQGSNEMVDKLNDIVWFINPEQDSFYNLFQRLEDYILKMAALKNIRIDSKISQNITDFDLSSVARRNLYLICKEAVNNAVKYSNATLLSVIIDKSNDYIKIMITDNGIGFDINNTRNGNGLKNIKNRANEIGAVLQINSDQRIGTSISLEIKA